MDPRSLRIAFFGLPLAALALQRAGHRLVFAGMSRRGCAGARRLRRALPREVPFLEAPRVDSKLVARVGEAKPDLLVSWFWPKKLPADVLALPPLGAFGVHPSLLPRWRGADPYFWAIDAGDEVTGVTAHRLEAEYDTGAILGRRTLAIDARWDAWALARALDRPSLELLVQTAARLGAGECREDRQDEADVTLAPAPDDALLRIDWERPADAIVRRIRASAPYPGAFTFLGDELVIVTRVELAEVPRVLRPGEAMAVGERGLVRCGEGGLVLLAGRRVLDDEPEQLLDAAAMAELIRGATS